MDEFFRRANGLEGAERSALLNCRLLVAGYAMDNMKPLDFAEALVPLAITGNPRSDDHVREVARQFVRSADLVTNQLLGSVRLALYGPNGEADGSSTVLDPVRQRFWAETEQPFYDALREAAEALISPEGVPVQRPGEAKKEAGAAWLAILKRHAFRVFDDTVPIDDATADDIEHVVTARRNLGLALDGFGATGKKLFAELKLPPAETKAKKP